MTVGTSPGSRTSACLSSRRRRSAGRGRNGVADDAGLSPLDVATGVAIPEFDGRVIGPSFAFKEVVDDDGDGQEIVATRADPERTRRLAALAVRTARLAYVPVEQRRVAIVLSAYPTKRARLGNAVGLDTPASAVELLDAMQVAGYRVAARAARRRRAHGRARRRLHVRARAA